MSFDEFKHSIVDMMYDYGTLTIIIAIIIAIIAVIGGSWLVACGIVKLITLCFNLTFSWKIATGIWFMYMVIHYIIKFN
jgi:hypothetical protein